MGRAGIDTHEIHACGSLVESQLSENGQLRVHPRDYRNSLTTSGPVRPCKSLKRRNGFSFSSPQSPHSFRRKQDFQ